MWNKYNFHFWGDAAASILNTTPSSMDGFKGKFTRNSKVFLLNISDQFQELGYPHHCNPIKGYRGVWSRDGVKCQLTLSLLWTSSWLKLVCWASPPFSGNTYIWLWYSIWLVVGPPLWKIWKFSWDDDIPNIWENKIDVPNHQPVIWGWWTSTNLSYHI